MIKRFILICFSPQDHTIGSNKTIFKQKLNGTYKPYTQGLEDDIFIYDKNGVLIEGKVCI